MSEPQPSQPEMSFRDLVQAFEVAQNNPDPFEAYLEGEIVTSRAMEPDESHKIERIVLERVLRAYCRMKKKWT